MSVPAVMTYWHQGWQVYRAPMFMHEVEICAARSDTADEVILEFWGTSEHWSMGKARCAAFIRRDYAEQLLEELEDALRVTREERDTG